MGALCPAGSETAWDVEHVGVLCGRGVVVFAFLIIIIIFFFFFFRFFVDGAACPDAAAPQGGRDDCRGRAEVGGNYAQEGGYGDLYVQTAAGVGTVDGR